MQYSEQVLDHFRHPRNLGELEDANGVAEVGDPGCGDVLRVAIRVADEHIVDIRFQCQGCPSAIACASLTTELARGKHVDEAWEIRDETIVEAIGGLPADKQHCSNLGASALHEAIIDWMTRELQKDSAHGPLD